MMIRPAAVILSLTLALGLLAACEAGEIEQAGETEQPGATEETAAVDSESVRQAIEASDRRWEEAALAGDGAALAALYTDDAIVLPPGAARAEGRAAIESMFAEGFATRPSSVTLATDHVEVAESGDMAYAVGQYDMAGTGPDGSAWTDTGKYMAVFENVDGEWLIASDIWNSDTSPAAESGGTEAAM